MKRISLLASIFVAFSSGAQFTQADSLRGGYGEGRNWWDLKQYELHVEFDIESQEIRGSNVIRFAPAADRSNPALPRPMQIDLQAPMTIDSILLAGDPLNGVRPAMLSGDQIRHIGNAWFVSIPDRTIPEITVYFHGKPKQAVNPPWDGGMIWTEDPNGNPWVTVACQGLGASVWFPCKDSQTDEPDNGVKMFYTCDSKLMCVSNGHFIGRTDHPNGKSTYGWEVENPINNYCMIPYIGDYVNIHEHYKGEKGILELDYWVIRGNEEKAQAQFRDAPRTLEALEHWFGPYPFYEDGYKLVEAPHLGMEHQSAVAYGNGFQNGYRGTDLSGTGEGLKWDFIIVHESGHEWFGNNITSKDIADMWIHEAFTDYSETLFMDYWFGTEHANAYVIGLRRNILNDRPVIGPYGVNAEGSGDMYFKGANMLHTIRQLVGNDSVFRKMLRELNATFYHATVTTQEIEGFIIAFCKSHDVYADLQPVFDQYLRGVKPPVLEMEHRKKAVRYRWSETVPGFSMRVRLTNGDWIAPTRRWKKYKLKKRPVPQVDPNFYIEAVPVSDTH